MVEYERYRNGNLKVVFTHGGSYKTEVSDSIERLPDNVAYISTKYIDDLKKQVRKCRKVKAANNSPKRQAYEFSF